MTESPQSIRQVQSTQRLLALVLASASLLALAPNARASSATLLLEEPYGKLGFFTATGHAAVYLSGVCADSPLVLRRCAPGETGVVLSRYNGVGGYDWVAIPLIPYLYAVENADDVPLFADARMVSFLRDQYRRRSLEAVAPDLADGGTPGGNWYELVGSSYDRTIYGYEIETSGAQDEALIRKYNSSANESHFHTVSRNCADFAKDVINFYYPRSLHRSLVADVGITTPKQMAKLLVRYSSHHPELQFARTIIPQVPGSAARSSNVHGVVESFFKSKKYIVPSAIVSPIFAGCVFAVYEGTGGGRFDPARNALVFSPGNDPDAVLGSEDRRAYEKELSHLLAQAQATGSTPRVMKTWEKMEAKASPGFDDQGRPMLQMQLDSRPVNVGISAGNVLHGNAPARVTQELLEARLLEELRDKKPHAASESEVTRDWILLQQAMQQGGEEIAARNSRRQPLQASAKSGAVPSRGEPTHGNLP
jgi:hypothetical protein